MNSSGTYRIKPAGRHILTIGRDLIQDNFAAVVELVKNAYDADSPDVDINFTTSPDRDGYTIVISDHGHGMSRDTVIDKWMVPSTRDKLDRGKSPAGRVMQGRKGVGRYAASILGNDLLLETITSEGTKTTIFIEWSSFETTRYLEDVEILIETIETSESAGSNLTIHGDSKFLNGWNKDQFRKLKFELKKLISPVNTILADGNNTDNFQIRLTVKGFPDVQDISEKVEPLPLFDLFDYRIAGEVSADGKGTLTYYLQKIRNATPEKINFDDEKSTGCGTLLFDIRVYDREKESIDALIKRGLKNEAGNYVGKLEARQLLNEYNGIGVYRNGFRLRPLGDADFDWLKLNEQRVQNPSLRIGSNQVIGYVQIQSEEESELIEKSARDGLRENTAYEHLKQITKGVISKLEAKRFSYRKEARISRSALKIEQEFERLFVSDDLKRNIQRILSKRGVDKKATADIIEVVNQDAERKNKKAEELRQAVAVYQGQATLGKIINVILHEGRHPLSYFRNQIPNLRAWCEHIKETYGDKHMEKMISMINGLAKNAEIFVNLFGRLDPLAAGNRSAKKPLNLVDEIRNALSVFEETMKSQDVFVNVVGSDDFLLPCWSQDIYAIFTNLIDNSLYWMSEKKVKEKKITIELVTTDSRLLNVDYRDTGPGIEPSLIASEVIFEPQFSTKPSGVGIGLAIAGEAANRNGLELKAYDSEFGAYFRLQPNEENDYEVN